MTGVSSTEFRDGSFSVGNDPHSKIRKHSQNYVQTLVDQGADGSLTVREVTSKVSYETDTTVPTVGVMIVGINGNNGTTLVGGMIANHLGLQWEDKTGTQSSNWLGSVALSGTIKLGQSSSSGHDVFVPIKNLIPLLNPDDIKIGGWDISGIPMRDAMRNAAVYPLELQRQLYKELSGVTVLPGAYCRDFIATNQEVRADHLISATTKQGQLDTIRQDIRNFKQVSNVEKLIILWSGNTERFSDHLFGIHDSGKNLLDGIKANQSEIAPSLIYATAAVLEGCSGFINGSPQNTFCDGLIELAKESGTMLAGDDLKTGQTKFKSVMADYMVSTAIKPTSIVSYNHLGNNDGLNLSSERQFRSKEITKASVVDDMIASNGMLYKGDHPDHLIVIKYVPSVGDSKRAMDEYTSDIFMNGKQTIVVHNTCEDSLLAAPIILDLIIFMEVLQRIKVHVEGVHQPMHTLVSLLSMFLKAPKVPEHAPVINALFPQREALVDFLRAAAGLPPTDYLCLPHRLIAKGSK